MSSEISSVLFAGRGSLHQLDSAILSGCSTEGAQLSLSGSKSFVLGPSGQPTLGPFTVSFAVSAEISSSFSFELSQDALNEAIPTAFISFQGSIPQQLTPLGLHSNPTGNALLNVSYFRYGNKTCENSPHTQGEPREFPMQAVFVTAQLSSLSLPDLIMAIAPQSAHQALAPIVTVCDAVGLPTMNDPTLTLALGAGHGPSGCIATLDEQYGEESPPLMASYPAFSNFQSDGLYFTTTLSFAANSLFGHAICLVGQVFGQSPCNRNVPTEVYVPFTSGSRMPDTGAATVSTVLNRNGLTFGNQLIRHMEQTTIQLNNPGTSNWNVQVTMNNMAVYLPSGFAFDNRGLYPTGWAWRFNMTVLGMITGSQVSLGAQIVIPGGWHNPLGLNAFILNEVSITLIRYYTGGTAFDMQLTSQFVLVGEQFTLGLQFPLPITPPPTYIPLLSSNFGLFFSADTPVTARDALRMAQTIRLGQVLIDPPAFLDSIVINAFEVCVAPNREVTFWISDSERDTTCGPGLRANVEIQIFSLTATFTIEATMNTAAHATEEMTQQLLLEAAATVRSTKSALTDSEELLLHAANHTGAKHIQMLMAHPTKADLTDSMYNLIVKHHPEHQEFHPDNVALWHEGAVAELQSGGSSPPSFGGGSLTISVTGVHQLINDAVTGLTNLILGNNASWNWLRNAIQSFFQNFNIRSVSFSHTMSANGQVSLQFDMGLTINGNIRDLNLDINFSFSNLLSIISRMGGQLVSSVLGFPAPPFPNGHVCLVANHCASNVCRIGTCNTCSSMIRSGCNHYGRFACTWTPTPGNCASRATSIGCRSPCTWTRQYGSCASRWNGRRPAIRPTGGCSCSRYGGGWPRRVRCTGSYVRVGQGSCSGTANQAGLAGSCQPNAAAAATSAVAAKAVHVDENTPDQAFDDLAFDEETETWVNVTAMEPTAEEKAVHEAMVQEEEREAERLAIDEDYQRALAANATDPTETIDALQVFGLIAHSLPDWDMKRTHAIMESIGAHNGDAVLMHEWIRSKHQHVKNLIEQHSEEMRVEKASRPKTEWEILEEERAKKLTYRDLMGRKDLREAAAKIKPVPVSSMVESSVRK